MAKAPGWMRTKIIKQDGHIVIEVTVRRWHPGWWWEYFKSLRDTANELHIPFHSWFRYYLAHVVSPPKAKRRINHDN